MTTCLCMPTQVLACPATDAAVINSLEVVIGGNEKCKWQSMPWLSRKLLFLGRQDCNTWGYAFVYRFHKSIVKRKSCPEPKFTFCIHPASGKHRCAAHFFLVQRIITAPLDKRLWFSNEYVSRAVASHRKWSSLSACVWRLLFSQCSSAVQMIIRWWTSQPWAVYVDRRWCRHRAGNSTPLEAFAMHNHLLEIYVSA